MRRTNIFTPLLVLFLLVLGVMGLVAPYALVFLFMEMLRHWLFVLPLFLWFVGALAASKREYTGSVVFKGIAVVLALILVAAYPYARALTYLANTETVRANAYNTGYDTRFMPYNVGINASRNKMSAFGTTLDNVVYIYDPQNGERITAIGGGSGLTIKTKSIVAVYANDKVDTCDISGYKYPAIHNGYLWNNLQNYVIWKVGWAHIDPEDVYGDCLNNVGRIYIPFSKPAFPFGHFVPGGVIVLENGQVSVYKNAPPANLVGPLYPASVQIAQEESLNYLEGWSAHVFNGYGYEFSFGQDDPNNLNKGQFNLKVKDAELTAYVSAMTAKGDSRSFVGETNVTSSTFTNGRLNKLTFVIYTKPHSGTVDLASKVRDNYPNLAWSSGLQVLEIIPGPDGDYVGYISYSTKVAYVVYFRLDGTLNLVAQSVDLNSASPQSELSCDQAWQVLDNHAVSRDAASVATALGDIMRACPTK